MASSSRNKLDSTNEVMHQFAVILKSGMDEWMSVSARLATFENRWLYDKEEGAKCTAIALAQAGFEMTDAEETSARCVCCNKEMIWESTDDPFEEHSTHSPSCYFVVEGKPESEMTTLDFIRMTLWRSAFEKTTSYRDYIDSLQDAMDNARVRCHELLVAAERKVRDI